jgi:hypothetical protein
MGALALVKGAAASDAPLPVILLCAAYALFAAAFLLVLFRHPAAPPHA